MAARSERQRFEDILSAADAALAASRRRRTAVDAVERDICDRAMRQALMEIGEAVKALSSDTKRRHTGVRWAGFAGLRDVLIHQYHRIEQHRLDGVFTADLPALVVAAKSELDR